MGSVVVWREVVGIKLGGEMIMRSLVEMGVGGWVSGGRW